MLPTIFKATTVIKTLIHEFFHSLTCGKIIVDLKKVSTHLLTKLSHLLRRVLRGSIIKEDQEPNCKVGNK